MENTRMNIIKRIIFFCCCINSVIPLFAQHAEPDIPLELELTVKNDSIRHLDLLEYEIKLSNNGKDSIELIEPWAQCYKPRLEYRFSPDSTWRILPFSNKGAVAFVNSPFRNINYPKMITLKENDSIDRMFVWAPFFIDKELRDEYFSASKMYLRTQVFPCIGVISPIDFPYDWGYIPQAYPCDKNSIISDEIVITFHPYEDRESQKAYQWLKTKKMPTFFYEMVPGGMVAWGFYTGVDHPETLTETKELIHKFPNTDFAGWAKLHLAIAYYWGLSDSLNHAPDYEKVKALLTELKNVKSDFIQTFRKGLLDMVDFDPFRE